MKALLLTGVVLTLFISAIPVQDTPRVVGRASLVDGSQTIEMRYSISSPRGKVGFMNKTKVYFVFGGSKANLRITNPLPAFEFYADSGLNVDTAIYLFRFDPEKDRRQVRVGKADGKTATTGVPKDHLIASTIKEIGDGPNSTKRYRLTPSAALRPGEYCLVRSDESCFDFGVDKALIPSIRP